MDHDPGRLSIDAGSVARALEAVSFIPTSAGEVLLVIGLDGSLLSVSEPVSGDELYVMMSVAESEAARYPAAPEPAPSAPAAHRHRRYHSRRSESPPHNPKDGSIQRRHRTQPSGSEQ
jgi:hypothetical protein